MRFSLAALTVFILSSGCSFQQFRSALSPGATEPNVVSSATPETSAPPVAPSSTAANQVTVGSPVSVAPQIWSQETINADLLNTLDTTCSESYQELVGLTQESVQALQAKGIETSYPDVLTSIHKATQILEGKDYPCAQLFTAVTQVGGQIPTR